MEQGINVYENAELPVGYVEIDYVLLTHAHIDHAGLLPWISARGFQGQVITTYATADLCEIMLRDSAHIQEMEAEWKNRKARRAGHQEVEALYTTHDAENVLSHFEGVAYGQKFKLNDNLTLRFTDVGHLLGSASIEIWATEGEETRKIVFSGDIGNQNKPLIRDPQYIEEADYVVMESTYGNRSHNRSENHIERLAKIIERTLERGGNVVIPAFAVGRTQELLYMIRHIKAEKLVKGDENFQVYVDSPLAVEATHVFKENLLECYDDETKELVEQGINPIDFPGLILAISSEDSKNINFDLTPKVIISAAGMCDAGRIRHHLKHNLWRPECTVVFAGYQAEGTLGRLLQDGAQTVKIFGEEIDVRAHIETMEGISGHADREGLLTWISAFTKKPEYVFVVHGSEESCTAFTDTLRTKLALTAKAPFSGSEFDLINGCWLKETEGIPVAKETVARRRADGVYTRLVDAGKLLLDVIGRNEGGANRDLTKFTEQILTLCKKWDR
jgi:metallo-beta-lactamase family protein